MSESERFSRGSTDEAAYWTGEEREEWLASLRRARHHLEELFRWADADPPGSHFLVEVQQHFVAAAATMEAAGEFHDRVSRRAP